MVSEVFRTGVTLIDTYVTNQARSVAARIGELPTRAEPPSVKCVVINREFVGQGSDLA